MRFRGVWRREKEKKKKREREKKKQQRLLRHSALGAGRWLPRRWAGMTSGTRQREWKGASKRFLSPSLSFLPICWAFTARISIQTHIAAFKFPQIMTVRRTEAETSIMLLLKWPSVVLNYSPQYSFFFPPLLIPNSAAAAACMWTTV